MPNLSSKTRKQLVLDYLMAHKNQWVPGIELMNQYVGGLRAGARMYDLRREGWNIRRSADPNSDVDRYMLVIAEKPVQLTVEDIWGS